MPLSHSKIEPRVYWKKSLPFGQPESHSGQITQLFIHLWVQQIFKTYSLPCTMLCAEGTVMSKTNEAPVSWGANSLVEASNTESCKYLISSSNKCMFKKYRVLWEHLTRRLRERLSKEVTFKWSYARVSRSLPGNKKKSLRRQNSLHQGPEAEGS